MLIVSPNFVSCLQSKQRFEETDEVDACGELEIEEQTTKLLLSPALAGPEWCLLSHMRDR
jgi:hypothetical protein